MSATAMAANLRRWRIAVGTHDVENPGHDPAYGIALNPFDIKRLGLDVGEELWSGVSLYEDSGCTSNFRILCDGEHAEKESRVGVARPVLGGGIEEGDDEDEEHHHRARVNDELDGEEELRVEDEEDGREQAHGEHEGQRRVDRLRGEDDTEGGDTGEDEQGDEQGVHFASGRTGGSATLGGWMEIPCAPGVAGPSPLCASAMSHATRGLTPWSGSSRPR